MHNGTIQANYVSPTSTSGSLSKDNMWSLGYEEVKKSSAPLQKFGNLR
jgi:hypothetical protein